MKRLHAVLAAAGLLLMISVFAAHDTSVTAAEGTGVTGAQDTIAKAAPPPVSQALVREGNFAVDLAVALKLGKPGTEAEAEDMLAKAGISPKNGWIADYPVTPDVLGELQDSVGKAADSGTLSMSRDEAYKAFSKLAKDYGLNIEPAKDTAAAEGGGLEFGEYSTSEVTDYYGEYSEPTVIQNYYYEYGPPVVTYYQPPWDYWYLYSWVGYPFWCYGYWYPGYFILNDFSVTIIVNDGGVATVGTGSTSTQAVVTNHVTDPATGKVTTVSPASGTAISALDSDRRWKGDRDRVSGTTGTSGFTESAGSIVSNTERRREFREQRRQAGDTGIVGGSTPAFGRVSKGDQNSVTGQRDTGKAVRSRGSFDRPKMLGFRGGSDRATEGVSRFERRSSGASRAESAVSSNNNARPERSWGGRERSGRSYERQSFSRPSASMAPVERSFSRPSASMAPVERSFSRPSASMAPVERSFSRPSASSAPVERSFSRPSASSAPVERSFSRPSEAGGGFGGGGRGFKGCRGGNC